MVVKWVTVCFIRCSMSAADGSFFILMSSFGRGGSLSEGPGLSHGAVS